MKDNQYATVEEDGYLVIKKFKLGQEFLIDNYRKNFHYMRCFYHKFLE